MSNRRALHMSKDNVCGSRTKPLEIIVMSTKIPTHRHIGIPTVVWYGQFGLLWWAVQDPLSIEDPVSKPWFLWICLVDHIFFVLILYLYPLHNIYAWIKVMFNLCSFNSRASYIHIGMIWDFWQLISRWFSAFQTPTRLRSVKTCQTSCKPTQL